MMNIISKTRLKELFRSRRDAIVFIIMILVAFFFAARTIMAGYDLYRVFLTSSGWNILQSRAMIQFLEWLFPLLGLLAFLTILILRTSKKFFLIPFLFFANIVWSIITLQSEAVGIEEHGWRTLRAARSVIIFECVILPIFVLVLLLSEWKRSGRTIK